MHIANIARGARRAKHALLAMAATLSAAAASAAPSFGFDPSCSDKSISDYLAPIFGSLFSKCGGSSGGFEAAMGILCAGALSIGGILAAYTLVAGTMQTAHDGEMLGKKWSSMWLPIRTTLGIGLVVPIAKGYCVAQLVVGFLIGQGVGLADSVWNGFLGSFATPKSMAPKARMPNVADLARSLLNSQICLEGYNALREPTTSVILDAPMAKTMPLPGTWSYGLNGAAQCGAIEYDQTPINSELPASLALATYDAAPLTSVQAAHMAGLAKMEAILQPTARAVVQSVLKGAASPDANTALTKAVIAYQATVSAASESVFGSGQKSALQAMLDASKNDGWSLAGAWFMKAAQMQDAVNQTVSKVPQARSPDYAGLYHVSTPLNNFFIRANAILEAPSLASAPGQSTMNNPTVLSVDQLGNSANIFQKGIQYAMNSIMGGNWIANLAQVNPNRSPIMAIKDFGDYLMTGSEAGIAAGVGMISLSGSMSAVNSSVLGEVAGVATLGTSKGAAGGLASGLQVVGYLVIFLSMSMLAFASAISVYLPMAPFLLYYGAFLGWLILCAEAVIAAPLWAIMHLTPSGDDVMGGARQGYTILMGLLLRPTLVVLGFCFALTAIDAVALGFNAVFFPAFKIAMVGSVVGVGTSLAMIMIYFGSLVWIFHTLFGLIHIIPDKLLRWIGGGHEQLGESAGGLGRVGREAAAGASRHMDAVKGQMVSGVTAKTALDRKRSDADDKRAAAVQKTESDKRSAGSAAKTSMDAARQANAKANEPGASAATQLAAIAANTSALAALERSGDISDEAESKRAELLSGASERYKAMGTQAEAARSRAESAKPADAQAAQSRLEAARYAAAQGAAGASEMWQAEAGRLESAEASPTLVAAASQKAESFRAQALVLAAGEPPAQQGPAQEKTQP